MKIIYHTSLQHVILPMKISYNKSLQCVINRRMLFLKTNYLIYLQVGFRYQNDFHENKLPYISQTCSIGIKRFSMHLFIVWYRHHNVFHEPIFIVWHRYQRVILNSKVPYISGAHPGRPPPKIGKNIFHKKYHNNFRASLRNWKK